MKFVNECTDYGAPEFVAAGVSSIDRASENTVRVTYYSRRRDGNVDVCHVVWDKDEWRQYIELLNRTCEAILAEPLDRVNDHPPRHAH
jgi:hypothetical protein